VGIHGFGTAQVSMKLFSGTYSLPSQLASSNAGECAEAGHVRDQRER